MLKEMITEVPDESSATQLVARGSVGKSGGVKLIHVLNGDSQAVVACIRTDTMCDAWDGYSEHNERDMDRG